jgi:hypothetical protein
MRLSELSPDQSVELLEDAVKPLLGLGGTEVCGGWDAGRAYQEVRLDNRVILFELRPSHRGPYLAVKVTYSRHRGAAPVFERSTDANLAADDAVMWLTSTLSGL